MFCVDPIGLLCRQRLRERTAELIAEACAWSVGLSDQPHVVRRTDRLVPSGVTLAVRAETGLPLSAEEGRLELEEARPGTFRDALNALRQDGRLYADVFDEQVLAAFVLETCVQAAAQARENHPQVWEELLDELGEDGDDLEPVVRATDWEAPLRIDAEQLVLAALGDVPLVEVEAEGLPLSLVRAAERELQRAAPALADPPDDEELAGALFLAQAALREAGLPDPVPPERADRLLEALLAEGLEAQEVLDVLPHLPVLQDTADEVAATVRVLPEI